MGEEERVPLPVEDEGEESSQQSAPSSKDPRVLWVLILGIVFYGVLVALGLVTRLLRPEWTNILVSLPCFAVAGWFGYIYFVEPSARMMWGLVVSGIGWASVGIAFLAKPPTEMEAAGVTVDRVFSWIAVVCIVAGGTVGMLAVRGSRASRGGTKPLGPAEQPDSHPGSQ